MTKRVWALLLALGLSLSIQGCGDDDTGGGGNAGSSGNAGRGSSGSGSGNAGSGNPDDAIADCMAQQMMGGSGGAASCDGIEEYSACVQDMCSAEGCASRGCQPYFDCVNDAADPCMPTGCPAPTGDCAACLAETGTCTLNNCFDLIMCGETAAGGPCDQVDDCCAAQPESMRMICMQAAMGARAAGGDALCTMLVPAFCP